MAARTGQEYITGLRERAVEVYIGGERVKDVTTHPTLSNGVRTLASLYDMQGRSHQATASAGYGSSASQIGLSLQHYYPCPSFIRLDAGGHPYRAGPHDYHIGLEVLLWGHKANS